MLLPNIINGKLVKPKEIKKKCKRLHKTKRVKKLKKTKIKLKYKEYIKSLLWKKIKANYYKKFPKECVICKST